MRKVNVKPPCPSCKSVDVGVKEYKDSSVRFRCNNDDCTIKSFAVKWDDIEKLETTEKIIEERVEETSDFYCPKCGSSTRHYGFRTVDNVSRKEYKCDSCDEVTIEPISEADIEIVEENVKLAKSKQKSMDKNRVERKAFRESARIDNTLEELNSKLIDILSENNLKDLTIKHDSEFDKPVGIIQISDAHFGEVVNQSSNQYNWSIATKRLKKLVSKARIIFDGLGIDTVALLFTGDLMNSDRRLDEILTNSENRSQTMFIASRVLSKLILDLNKSYNVIVKSIIGNESRVKDDVMFSSKLISDNYDYCIHNILKGLFEGCDGITFIGGQWDESIIEINGRNICMCHGTNLRPSGLDNHVQKMIGKYASSGTIIDYVIFGHIHSACISDKYARSSSLVGDNAYSNKGLNLSGRASQNIHIVYPDAIDSMKIDLHDVTGIEGYDFEEKYENYVEVKDESNTTIFKVVI